jgi:hypothetical protein
MSRHEVSEPQRRDWRMLTYGAAVPAPAAVLLVAWPKLAANLFANGFAEQMFMPHGMCYLWVPQLYFLARKLRPPHRALLRGDLVHAYLSHLSRSPRHAFFMDLCGLRRIHLLLQHYPLHGSVDDLERDLLALRLCQTSDRGGLGGDRRGASFPRSQGAHADSNRETLGGAKGAIGESWRKPVTRGFALGRRTS